MKRDPSRPKAEDISDLDMLIAARDRGLGPLNRMYPYKVVQAKVDKLVKRGLLNARGPRLALTEAGRVFIETMQHARTAPDEVPAFVPDREFGEEANGT